MLHIKFQGHRPFGPGEEDIFKVFTIRSYIGMTAILVMWPGPFEQTRRRLHMKFDFNRPSGFRGEDI